jgi:mRNA-degrading endonuclease RelE of RelBE toxin-antitoxin system
LWKAKLSNRFKSSYKNLSDEMAQKVESALESLLSANRPERLGIPKKANRKGYFAYELGRSCRIIYRPNYGEKIVEFFRVCSHTEVYYP